MKEVEIIASNVEMARNISFLQMSSHIPEASRFGHTDIESQKRKFDRHTPRGSGGGDQGGGDGGVNKNDKSYFEDGEEGKQGGGDGKSGKEKDGSHSDSRIDDKHRDGHREKHTRRPLQVDRY